MKKACLFFFALLVLAQAKAQKDPIMDTLPDYDMLFSELEHFIDSITAPRSFALINIGYGTGHFQYQTSRTAIKEIRKGIGTPTVGYYNKSGLGIGAVGSLISENNKLLLYQTAVTASYDYLKNRKFLTGVSFTHFFTKDSLPFYTSPLNNQVYAYFSYRDWWLKPALAAGYGWGSITSVQQRKEKIKLLKKGPPATSTTTIETTEAIADLSLTASVKHDFYWLNVLSKRDYVRLTPQLVVLGGTQKYGLNQTNNSFISEKHSSTSVLYNTEKSYITARSQFQLLSLSGRLRTEFSKGIFFVQPQVLFDYYLPKEEREFAAAFVINAGILF